MPDEVDNNQEENTNVGESSTLVNTNVQPPPKRKRGRPPWKGLPGYPQARPKRALKQYKRTDIDAIEDVPIDWTNYKTYLISLGLSQTTIRQYHSQARAFCRLYYKDIEGDPEGLFRNINLFMQIKKVRGDRIERANKKWAIYALKCLFEFIGKKELFQQYFEKYGTHIPVLPRKILSKELNPEQILLLYERLDFPWKMIMALQYETGARISEILQLKKENIVSRQGYMTLSVRVKGGAKRELIVMNQKTIDDLKPIIESAGDNFLFTDNGRRITLDDVNHLYSKIGHEFFERPLTSHWLRHSRGLHIYNKNHDILEVKEALGHSDIRTTYGYLKSAGVITKDIMKNNPVPW